MPLNLRNSTRFAHRLQPMSTHIAPLISIAQAAPRCGLARKPARQPFAPCKPHSAARRGGAVRPRAAARRAEADVVVVGAGVAGLNAAAKLHAAGGHCRTVCLWIQMQTCQSQQSALHACRGRCAAAGGVRRRWRTGAHAALKVRLSCSLSLWAPRDLPSSFGHLTAPITRRLHSAAAL